MINETALEGDFEALGQTKGKIALAKSFSTIIVMLVTAYFGLFCFTPEIMAVPTHLNLSVGLLLFPALILSCVVISVLFVFCAEKHDRLVSKAQAGEQRA